MGARVDCHLAGLILVIGVILILAGCVPVPPAQQGGPPPADSRDLNAIHRAGSPQFNAQCLNCHSNIMKRTTLNPKFKEAHAAMIPFLPDFDAKVGVTNENCLSCHAKVDIIQHSGIQIRKNADVQLCQACHSKDGAASKKFYAN